MKTYVAQIVAMTRDRASRRNLRILGRFLLVLGDLIGLSQELAQITERTGRAAPDVET